MQHEGANQTAEPDRNSKAIDRPMRSWSTATPRRRMLRCPRAALAAATLLGVCLLLLLLLSASSPRAADSDADAPRLHHVDLTGDRPAGVWSDADFECLGWRATRDCDPHGARDPAHDRGCDAPLPGGAGGFCEVRNRSSGQVLRVMLSTCSSWRWRFVPRLSCADARQFTDFSVLAAGYTHPAAERPAATRGIALVAYPKVIAGVYAVVRTLRSLGCELPVELWIHAAELSARHSVLQELVRRFHCIVRVIHDPHATKFHAKPYAIYHSRFESVLFLDSDNIPVRDPTYLFDSREFRDKGAIFWPDLWRPMARTPFNVHEQSALWRLLDMPFTDMFEQESGQILVNRSRATAALSKLMFYAARRPRLITDWRLVHGDKDLFRLAWLNTSTPFLMVQHLAMLGGRLDEPDGAFCGVAMVQRGPDAAGDILFVHRNQQKLSGRPDEPAALVTHLQRFTGGDGTARSLPSELDKYRVRTDYWVLGQHTCLSFQPRTAGGERTPFVVERASAAQVEVERRAGAFAAQARALLSDEESASARAADTQEREHLARQWASFRRDVVAACGLAAALPLLTLLASTRPWTRRRRRRRGGRRHDAKVRCD